MEKRFTDIVSFVKESKKFSSGNNIVLELWPLRKKEIDELKIFFNIDFSDYVRSIDDASVRHALKHKNLTIEDFLLIDVITVDYDFVCYDVDQKKIIYSKKITDKRRTNNGERNFYYVEYIQTGNKRMAMKTMYKSKIL